MFDQLLLTNVADLFILVSAISGTVAFVAYQAGRWVGRSEGADERATLKLQLKLARETPQDDVFVDLANAYGLLDPQEPVR